MYCSKCGAYAPEGSAYCARCGERIVSAVRKPARKAISKGKIALAALLLVAALCGCVALLLGSGSPAAEKHGMREWFGPDFVQFRIVDAFSESLLTLPDGKRCGATMGKSRLVGFEGTIVNYGDRALPLENLGVRLTFDGGEEPEDCPFLYAFDNSYGYGEADPSVLESGASFKLYAFAERGKGAKLRSIRLSFAGSFEEGPLNRMRSGPNGAELSTPERVEGATRYAYLVDCA